MNKLPILTIMLIIFGTLITGASATEDTNVTFIESMCGQEQTFLGRLRDKCSYDNSICEDAENPITNSEDCSLNMDAISCKGDRCIFKEIWLVKGLAILALLLIFSDKKDYKILIILIVFIIVINFISNPQVELMKDRITNIMPKNNNSIVIISREQINDNKIMNYGGKIMPSNPQMGFLIGLVALFFISRAIFKAYIYGR